MRRLLALNPSSRPRGTSRGSSGAIPATPTRLGKPSATERATVIAYLDPHFPAADANLNSELLQMLVYLDAPIAVAKGMKLIIVLALEEQLPDKKFNPSIAAPSAIPSSKP